jgi:diamine N-acetyltransferase
MSAAQQLWIVAGQRVLIRSWTRSDAVAQELWPPYTEPFHSFWNLVRLESYYDYGRSGSQRFIWAVDDMSGRLIGRISLREVSSDSSSARLGISLSGAYVSQGLGSEAMRLFLNYYFGPLGFRTMLLDVAACNERAVRCYERLGFSYVESDWRSAGNDPALRLLSDPRYAHMAPYFRRGRFETHVEFYEMRLDRSSWRGESA